MAELAIDGDINTLSHTSCAWDTDLWYKMEFDAVYCFPEIVIMQFYQNYYSYRMQDLKVLLIDSATGTDSLCGTLRSTQVATIAGQTYKIPCDACGNQVQLRVRHNQSEYPKSRAQGQTQRGCIHMREIRAVQTGSCVVSFKIK